MVVDALILAGGRSSRLGGMPKSQLSIDGMTLLARTVRAATDAGVRHLIIVGEHGVGGHGVGEHGVDAVAAVREQPAFAGPVAGIAAGLRALPGDSDATLLLACDMPDVARALPAVLDEIVGDGLIASDRGRRQPLVVVVRTRALVRALASLPSVIDASMRELFESLDLSEVHVPEGSTDDIDTWDDAARFGAIAPTTIGSST